MSEIFAPRLNLRLSCPVDGTEQTVGFQTSPAHCGDFLDVVSCTLVGDARPFECGKACRYLTVAWKEYCRDLCINALLYPGDRQFSKRSTLLIKTGDECL